VCWPWEASSCLIEACDCASDCCLAGVTLETSKTYQPNCVLIGPVSLPLSAPKTPVSRAFSCWPLATPLSCPPLDFEAWSIEYFLATEFHDWPESSAAFAWAALSFVLVRTMRRSRRSGVEKRDLFFS